MGSFDWGSRKSRVGSSARPASMLVTAILLTAVIPVTACSVAGAPAPFRDLWVMLDPDEAYADITGTHGTRLPFNCTVSLSQTSLTNSNIVVEFTVPRDWGVWPDRYETRAMNQLTVWFGVEVIVPPGASCEEEHVLRADAYIDTLGPGDKEVYDESIIHVNPYCDGSLSVHPCSVRAGPGETVSIEGQAINTGGEGANFRLDFDDPPPGIVASVEPEQVTLQVGESAPFYVEISVEEGVEPKEHTLVLFMWNAREGRVASHDITVDTNPLRAELEVDPMTAPPGMDVTFDASGSVVTATPAKYMFEFGDGQNTGWQDEAVVTHAYGREGRFTAKLKVEDGNGLRSTNDARVTVTVTTEGFKPTAQIVKVEPEVVTSGDEVTLTGTGAPVAGTSIRSYEWNSSRDGLLGRSAVLRTSSLSVGTHTITFRVEDERGVWSDPAQVELTVLPPRSQWSVVVVRPEEGAVLTGSTATVEGTCGYGDVAIDRVEVRVDEGEWMTASGRCEWTYTLDLSELEDGGHTLHVRAHAGGSVSDVVSVGFTKGEPSTTPIVGDLGTKGLLLVVLLVVIIGTAALATVRMRRRTEVL